MTGRQMFAGILSEARAAEYWRYARSKAEIEVEGAAVQVELFRIGHNASHDFWIGLLDDGRLITMSECAGEEIGETDRHVMVRGTADEAVWPPYLGHW